MKTDAQLQQDVIAELKWEPSVDATQIGVEVQDGIVTLSGQVSTCAEKCSAERATQRVAGVRALAVEMDITGSSKRTDTDIAGARKVHSWSERDLARHAARGTPSVRNVVTT